MCWDGRRRTSPLVHSWIVVNDLLREHIAAAVTA
jgi:hypothetical protein